MGIMKEGFVLLSILLIGLCSCKKEEQTEKIMIKAGADTLYNAKECVFTAETEAGIQEITFYFDEEEMLKTVSPPYTFRFTPENLSPGNHIVKCIAKTAGNGYCEGQLEIPSRVLPGESFRGGKVFCLYEGGIHGHPDSINTGKSISMHTKIHILVKKP